MRGRKFDRYRLVLAALSAVFKLFPRVVRRYLWSVSSPFGGMLAVGLRYCLLKATARSVGVNVYIGEYVIIRNMDHIEIGNNISIHAFSYIEALGGLRIGNNTSIAHSCSILTTSHTWYDGAVPIKYNEIITVPVSIGDDVWIGAGARILAGVEIEPRSIVAAGALVREKVCSFDVVGGVPAKRLKRIRT